MQIIESYVKNQFGERCREFQAGCASCEAYKALDFILFKKTIRFNNRGIPIIDKKTWKKLAMEEIKRFCGRRKEIGGDIALTLICTRKRLHKGMHSDTILYWIDDR